MLALSQMREPKEEVAKRRADVKAEKKETSQAEEEEETGG